MIWVAIPCYNGAATVGEVVRGVRSSGHRVLVVDDGSTDRSAQVATDAGADMVLRHPQNRGKGAALATSFAFATRCGVEALATLDADGQHDPADLSRLIAAHEQHQEALILGVRSFSPALMPRRSRIGNRISTWWISRFAGRAHTDTQTGFRVYPHRLFTSVRLRSRGFGTETELLLWAAKRDIALIEVPVQTIYSPRQVTHFHGLYDTLQLIALVLSSPCWHS